MPGQVTTRSRGAASSEGPVSIQVFSADRIAELHRMLVAHFASTAHSLQDLGLRDPSLLDQAVAYQFSGSGHHPLERTAALFQGLLDELPYHDGNAQTAFLALLLLLDDNGYVPNRVSFDGFLAFCSAAYEHRLAQGEGSHRQGRKLAAESDGSELAGILQWLTAHTRLEPIRDHPLTRVELARLLDVHGFQVREGDGSLQILTRPVEPSRRFFNLFPRREAEAPVLCRMSVPQGDGLVPLTSVRDARRACELEPGVFYDWQARADSFICQYRTLLVRLGRL